MLRFLRIQHLAVIDRVEVEFGAGLNVLTGETGAGKSILIEAVGLLLGGRASGDLVRSGEDVAAIEAVFEQDGEEIIVRREVTAQGRSRAFVNGALQTAGALRDLSARLIELHGQHEHHTLLDPATHVALLDDFGGLERHLTPVADAFTALAAVSAELADGRRAAADRTDKHALLSFQLEELDRTALKPQEDEHLASARQVLANAERVERLCAESYAALYERDDAVLALLGGVWRRVAELASIEPQFLPYVDAREGIKTQLEDLAVFLRRYADGVEASPERLHQIEARLAVLERLKRQYGPTLDDVMARRERTRHDLEALGVGEERIRALETAYAEARASYLQAARALSSARREAAPRFARAIERFLADLAMVQTRIELRFSVDEPAEDGWRADGTDGVEFYVSANPGEDLRPLSRIASGGELSRIMLAIKTLTATGRRGFTEADGRPPGAAAPGMIFDEVDAGIGGRAADAVGRTLRALASAFQVLCVTHLPQVAAYADTHLVIDKQMGRGRTLASVTTLDERGRIEELSRMLGGESITQGLRASAREMLLGRRGSGESRSKGESERAKAKGSRGPDRAV
jgi:DNA repair protein RecN (Recombination protein N)